VTLCGCHRAPDDSALRQAELLCEQRQWEAAIPLLKQHLLKNPLDGAAHFYLARCYGNARRPYFAVAEGEIQTALTVFIQNGRQSPLTGLSSQQFESSCYLELAEIYLRMLRIASRIGGSPAVAQQIFRQIDRVIEQARQLDPTSEELRKLDQILDRIRHPRATPPPAKEPEPHVAV
jgi:tetratricopeptide (TPR) repeat protein